MKYLHPIEEGKYFWDDVVIGPYERDVVGVIFDNDPVPTAQNTKFQSWPNFPFLIFYFHLIHRYAVPNAADKHCLPPTGTGELLPKIFHSFNENYLKFRMVIFLFCGIIIVISILE